MDKNKEQEYIEQMNKLSALAKSAYEVGAMNEKSKWIDSVQPYTMQITIKVRGDFDEVEHLKVVIGEREMRAGRIAFVETALRDMLLQIATKGNIARGWIENGISKEIS